ncbi:hypothetical protein [Mycobacterium sp. 1465703.0]|uniref:hypothetical protein n=1 Tax=Mycobacterium sp. 1465703.0 TaxID=1834078 RepID=UPI000AB3AB36|nr:hypothetical protein [Mycobacterium sp. 1465703.0]
MHTTKTLMMKVVAAGVLSAGAVLGGMGFGVGAAQAQPGYAPLVHGFPPEDGPVPPGASGPYTCCPGEEKTGLHPQTGRGCPGTEVHWDAGQCHTWYGVVWGHGNVAPGIWEGDGPPPPEAMQKPWCGFPFMCSGTP